MTTPTTRNYALETSMRMFGAAATSDRMPRQYGFHICRNSNSFNIGFMGMNEASLGAVIHLRTTEEHPFYISKINIRFLGQKTRGWSEPYNNDFEIKRNFEKICDINVNLWTSDENDEFKKLRNWIYHLTFLYPPSMTYLRRDNN
ncbi:3364_t:CDS:2 [Funneliformis mosseae]|uniref:3364_t:CDS:1 n=1 Tax=Funneliformis mosseae TaxID=27381 RepID=A0A9N8WFX7_FUNMO|nr:3364_t:CDS:2 [Funneliformis mosseae]